MPRGCALGYAAVGENNIHHYLYCPLLRPAILASRAIAPPLVVADGFELAFFAHPVTHIDTLRIVAWVYAVYSVVCAACHSGRPYRRDALAHVLRAAVRSLSSRVHLAHRLLFDRWPALPGVALWYERRVVGQEPWLLP